MPNFATFGLSFTEQCWRGFSSNSVYKQQQKIFLSVVEALKLIATKQENVYWFSFKGGRQVEGWWGGRVMTK